MGADPEQERIEELRDQVRLAREAIGRIAAEAAVHAPVAAPSPIVVYGTAAMLHGFYTALERVFASTARLWNGVPPEGADWHRRLLLAMGSPREGRRPAVLASGTLAQLDRYLRFRHLFRNLYVFELAWPELQPLMAGLPAVAAAVEQDLARFDAFLASLRS